MAPDTCRRSPGFCVGAALLIAGTLLSACASRGALEIPPTSPFADRSLSKYDAALRHHLIAGDSAALERANRAGPTDSLVRLLNRGLYLHRLGHFRQSNEALQAAERLAEERYTVSISQNVGAFLLSDNVLDYTPSALERAMIHYYGMLNYLAIDDLESALVEARKANGYLFRYNRDNEGRRTYANDAFVQYVAGLLHASAGDLNDALVSLRQADQAFERYRASFGIRPPRVFAEDLVRLAAAAGVPEVAEAAARKYGVTEPPGLPPGTRATTQEGELLVIVENGFVAHRTEEKVYVPVLRSERAMIGSGSIDEIVKAAMVIAVRTVFFMNQASREGRRYLRDYEGLLVLGSAALDAELISFAWPAYVLDGNAVDEIVVELAGSDPVDAVPVEDLSAISVRDFEEEKPKVLLRMLARVLLKETAVSRTAAAATKQGGEVVGFLARLGARTAATLTERADVRSWSLLPDEVRIARFTLPPGQHPLSIRVRDAGRGPWRRVDLGTVEIRNRRTTVRSAFVTGTSAGDTKRIRRAIREVEYHPPRRGGSR